MVVVVVVLSLGFVSKYRRQLDAIVADVVNYDESSNHFPIARHKARHTHSSSSAAPPREGSRG